MTSSPAYYGRWGCIWKLLGYVPSTLNPTEYRELLYRLRTQIRKDTVCSIHAYPEQLAKANFLIQELARFEQLFPEIKTLLPMLRQAIKAYYTEDGHRGWAQQFTLHDLDKLEAFCPPEE